MCEDLMQVSPSVRVTRFAQLAAGELIIYEHSGGSCVGMAVEDPVQGEKLLLPLGPNLPKSMRWPTLQKPKESTVVSFGQQFELRLPTVPAGWTIQEPPPEAQAICVGDDRAYFRPSFSWDPGEYSPCYVDMATGLILATGSGPSARFVLPQAILAFATDWRIVTASEESRVILESPKNLPQS
jgi:hypothetical protein